MSGMSQKASVVEILHDTGLNVVSLEDYKEKFDLVKVGTKCSSSGVYGVWGWKEDPKFLGRHSPSARMDGTSFVKYQDVMSDYIEGFYEQWEEGLIADSIYVDLTGNIQKFRNSHTGLSYKIDFQDMVQTNTQSGFTRAVRREEHFKSKSSETVKNLPSLPDDNVLPDSFTFLPTFSGQLIQVSKTISHDQGYYGKVLYAPEASKGCPTEGWFPAVLCKRASTNAMKNFVRATPTPIGDGAFNLMPPETWQAGKAGRVKVHCDSHEYRQVVMGFTDSLKRCCTVVNVERIQALEQWKLYAVKADSIRTRYAKDPASLVNNDQGGLEMKWLFHGTTAKTVPKIVSQGFNRVFAGRNATRYGKGAYFARHAEYSMRYAVSDKYGIKRMFLCRVAVGDWCMGKNGQLTPDCKPEKTDELFDSTVDDIANPSIFVVYHDTQVYPEYLVTFKK